MMYIFAFAALISVSLAQDNSTQAPAATTASVPTSTDCLDKVDTCRNSGAEGCVGRYEPYARANCARYCKYCINPEDLQKECKDNIDNCDEYQDDMCVNPLFTLFAEDNCQKFCNLCNAGPRPVFSGTTAGANQPATTAAVNGTCMDRVDYCWSEEDANCFGRYEPWAKVNCPYRCGFCDEKPPCEDLLNYCDEYDASVCTDSYYGGWARKNCRKSCNLCASPTRPPVDPNAATIDPNGQTQAPPSGAGTATPPSSGGSRTTLPPGNPGVDGAEVAGIRRTFIIEGPPPKVAGFCLYKGEAHAQDKNWYDGCDFTCNCFDAARNRIICTNRCIQWGAMSTNLTGCSLVQEPGDCCQRLECNAN